MALIRTSVHPVEFEVEPSRVTAPFSGPLGRRVARHRGEMLEAAARHGVTNLRVFGSVVRGDEGDDSDIDVLVDLPPQAGLFTLMRLEHELGQLLQGRVEVIPADSLRPEIRAHVERDLVAL